MFAIRFLLFSYQLSVFLSLYFFFLIFYNSIFQFVFWFIIGIRIIFIKGYLLFSIVGNPWNDIWLEDYERHMRLSSVYQLQTLGAMMREQLNDYSISSVCVLGVAGGNGLEYVDPAKIKIVYGIDINRGYLDVCQQRFPNLKGIFHPIQTDITLLPDGLPYSDLVLANLFVEYVGYECFVAAIAQMRPKIVSCIIQIDEHDDGEFVSPSPYTQKLSILNSIHRIIRVNVLSSYLKDIGYFRCKDKVVFLPNKKCLQRVDYKG